MYIAIPIYFSLDIFTDQMIYVYLIWTNYLHIHTYCIIIYTTYHNLYFVYWN